MTTITYTTRLRVRRAAALAERNLKVYNRKRLLLLAGLYEPLLYLMSLGYGLGAFVAPVPGPAGHPVSYRSFVAPALLAVAAMNGAFQETTVNFFLKLKHSRAYESLLVTPLTIVDIAVAEIAWALTRTVLYCSLFLGLLVATGDVSVLRALLCLPATALVGLCFAGIGLSVTTLFRSWHDFELLAIAQIPMLMFSTAFSPLGTYPAWCRMLTTITPLYQGVTLLRGLAEGDSAAHLLLAVLYLSCAGALGLRMGCRRLLRGQSAP